MNSNLLTTITKERIDAHYSAGFWKNDTIYSLVRDRARQLPGKFAIRDRFRRIAYGTLMARADALALDLASRGVRPGQRVAVWLPSRVEVAIALLACSRNGYVCCPSLHRDHTAAEVAQLLDRTRAAALIVEAGYGADAARRGPAQAGIVELATALPSMRHVYELPPLNAGEDTQDLALGEPAASHAQDAPSRDPNTVVYLAFTSGTTGVPKGVMHSDNTLLGNARSIAADWSIGVESVVYSLGPLSHNLGFGAMVMTLAAGGELVIHDLARGASTLARLHETGATFLFGVPTHAIDLLAELRAPGAAKPPSLRGFRISGAAAPADVVAELLRHGVTPQSGYGMTETCSHQYTLPNDDPKLIVETSGKACPGYEIRIWRLDDPETEAPVGEIGQIGGRGASLMLGYFNDQAATEESFNAKGWFMTGDLGWVDENGYLRITGRKKDVIIRGGHNIYPAKLESLAMQLDNIARVAAIAVADPRLGEKVCLAVTFRPGRRIEPRLVLDHLHAAGLSKYDMPEYFLETDHIPLTPSGKIRKVDLVESVRKGRLAPAPIRWQASK